MVTSKVFLLGTLEDLEAEEFKKFKWYLQQSDVLKEFPAIPKARLEKTDRVDTVDQMILTYSIKYTKVATMVLRMMNKNDLAERLSKTTTEPAEILAECQQKLKTNFEKKYLNVCEKITKGGDPKPLHKIYTEIYISMDDSGEVNMEHEVRQIEGACRSPEQQETTIIIDDIFKASPKGDKIKTVITKGMAGIGKTVLTQKFIMDWAEGKANQNIQLTFPFTFRELNVLQEKKFSLVDLVHHFFPEIKEAGISRFDYFQVVFIFDSLDEYRFPLDFDFHDILTDVTESASVGVLLTNLIRGKLLPCAGIWITTRPAAANMIPSEYVDLVTEVKGFTDPQKDDYFRKRYTDEEQARRIIAHIKASRSLHIMCHIPVFCWITAKILENYLKTEEGQVLPKNLTEMYIYFLMVQLKPKNFKYKHRASSHSDAESREMVSSLGKLAFEQLLKGDRIFYESDLEECNIDLSTASLYSGVFTEFFKDESGLYQTKVFCFVHLSVQEFLAALHVHQKFITSGVNLLTDVDEPSVNKPKKAKLEFLHLYKSAVDKALKSPNGHLDLFLRFLLGLSLDTNQKRLQGLLTQTKSSPETKKEIVSYVKKKVSEQFSPERSTNLFYCLSELQDCSLLDETQRHLSSGSLSAYKLSPAHWAALVFILQSSEKDLDVFDLKKYSASEETLMRLMPVVKASKKALLSCCNLSRRSCEALSSVLSSQTTSLKELDLSDNDLQDSGVKQLCVGLQSPNCKLETLRLVGCQVTEKGCAHLASALRSNPSHLRELDLSYNHPGDTGVKLLSAGLEDPQWQLDTLRMDCDGEIRLRPGLRKYFCELILDIDTANRFLKVSEDNKQMVRVREPQPYPDHPHKFDQNCHILCTNVLTGRSYWEIEWKQPVLVTLASRQINRGGYSWTRRFGMNNQSWCLSCSEEGYSIRHDKIETRLTLTPALSNRVAVYVDCPAGTLSFYKVCGTTLIHLHTFNTTFTESLYAGFGFGAPESSVFLCSP